MNSTVIFQYCRVSCNENIKSLNNDQHGYSWPLSVVSYKIIALISSKKKKKEKPTF